MESPMIEIDDERQALPIEQGALLCCIRLWVMAIRQGQAVEPQVDALLALLGAPSAAADMKAFMFDLNLGAARMIEIQCTCKTDIVADEWALLDVLSLAQALRSFEALLILRGFLAPNAARMALDRAVRVGRALAQAGRFLPPPEEDIRQYALSNGTGGPLRSAATLH